MGRTQWPRVEEILQRALDFEPDERAAFLDDACAGDEDLRRQVEALLDAGVFASDAPAVALPDAEPAESLVGRTIGHYRIEERIGAGGMGEVYTARDETLQRTVALKALPAAFLTDPDRVRRFEQEALAASRLNHPNIITIFETVRAADAFLIATERVEGKTVRELLREHRKLPLEEALDIAMQVTAALKAAHAARIIHRDIKPENLMVRADGVVKVLDFGIAKLSEDASPGERVPVPWIASSDLTFPGAVLGTASYMSPEQARGEALDGRTDLFSLGVVLYEMVAGERLFAGATDARTLRAAHLDGTLTGIRALEGTPKNLQRVLRRMLQPDRDARYASAGELLDDLTALRRRLEGRTSRRVVMITSAVAAAALVITAIAGRLSVNEVWDERVLRDGHTAAVRQVVFSPDGGLLVSCGEDGQVIVWDFVRRERLATLRHLAHKLAFSPDGRWFATGGQDGRVIVWDAARRTPLRILSDLQGVEIGALSASPDSSRLAAASYSRTAIWRTADWSRTHSFPSGGFGTFVFSRDGRQIVSSPGLRGYDLSTGERLPIPETSSNWIALSPDGARLAVVESNGILAFYRLRAPWDLSRFERLMRRRAHQDHGRSIAWSPDGRLVVSAADDILLWDGSTGEKIARFEYSSIVWSVAFSPDGKWLVSSHGDGAVLIWDVVERERVASLSEHSRAVRSVAFSPDGRTVASAGDDRAVTLWDTRLGRKRAVFTGHETRINAVALSGAGDLGSADMEGTTIFWDIPRRASRKIVSTPAHAILCLAFSPDGRFFANTTGIWEAGGRQLVDFRPINEVTHVYGVAFSSDGRVVAAVSERGYVMLWDVARRRQIAMQRRRGSSMIAVSLSPDGKWLATGEDEGPIRLWSVQPLSEVAVLGTHGARVKSVEFSPDGTTLASAGDDKTIALWDVRRRRLRTHIGTHTSPIYDVAFSPDGRQLVSGEHDRSVRLYTRRRTLWGMTLD